MIVHVHSTILRISLPHHFIAVKALVQLARKDRLEALLDEDHVLVHGGEVLLVWRRLASHTVHVVHRWIKAANVVQGTDVYDHVLVEAVEPEVFASLHEVAHIVVVAADDFLSARIVSHHVGHVVVSGGVLAKHLGSQHGLIWRHPWTGSWMLLVVPWVHLHIWELSIWYALHSNIIYAIHGTLIHHALG